MTPSHEKLKNKAVAKYGTIYPCGKKTNINQCFNEIKLNGENWLYLWFNTTTGSTKIVKTKFGHN